MYLTDFKGGRYQKSSLKRLTIRMNSLPKCGGSSAKQGNTIQDNVMYRLSAESHLLRLLGITADEDYGGLAMGYQAHCVVMEEISRASGMISRHHHQ